MTEVDLIDITDCVAFYKADDATQMDDTTPEDYGTVFTGNESSPVEIHIWNDQGGYKCDYSITN